MSRRFGAFLALDRSWCWPRVAVTGRHRPLIWMDRAPQRLPPLPLMRRRPSATCPRRAAPAGRGRGSAEQGVTDDAIVIGYGDDAGFSVLPGLDHELSDAMKAMIAWCNDQGGINGRPDRRPYYDAKFTEVVNVMQDACEQVFMLVGRAGRTTWPRRRSAWAVTWRRSRASR